MLCARGGAGRDTDPMTDPESDERAMAHIDEQIRGLQKQLGDLKAEVGKVLVGQDAMLHRLLVCFIAGGHVLLEGVPGLAKTLVVRTLASCIHGTFSRIQFTPDMLPGDVVGTQIFNPREGTFSIKRGPVFGNLVLADEINRAPAKVQSALLEAMQERQVTIGDETLMLPEPFLVMATMNPIEQEGTYALPEAQLDRFMLKLKVGYLSKDDEVKMIDRMACAQEAPTVSQVMDLKDMMEARRVAGELLVDEKVKRYVVDLVFATRQPAEAGLKQLAPLIEAGASPRASINLVKAGRAHALLSGRSYLSPHDIKTVALDVLRHRLMLTYEAEALGKTSDDVVQVILDNVPVP
jgi:MoxR-like ATPase